MRLGALVLVVVAGALPPTAGAAPPQRIVELPGLEALPKVPPLAPPQPPLVESPRLRGTVFARERVAVGIAPGGTPHTVTVLQRLLVRSLGDYSFFVPAPLVSVVAGTGSESQPGLRPNQIVWQGFAPRRRVLAALAELRPADSVPALPVRVRVSAAPKRPGPFEIVITLENTTRTKAVAFAADAVGADVAKALDALRAAARINRPIEGQGVRIRGQSKAATIDVWAPLALRGSLRFPAGTVRDARAPSFARRLGGKTLQVTVRGVALRAAAPKLTLEVEPLIGAAILPPSANTLEAAVVGYLRYARTRQFQSFLANPDPRGPSVTTYIYETAAAERSTARPEQRPTDESGLPAALVVGGLALLSVGLVVLWAHL